MAIGAIFTASTHSVAALDYNVYDDFIGASIDTTKWASDTWGALQVSNGALKITTSTSICTTGGGRWSADSYSGGGCYSGAVIREAIQVPFGIKTKYKLNTLETKLGFSGSSFQGRLSFRIWDENGNRYILSFGLGAVGAAYDIGLHIYQDNSARFPSYGVSQPISQAEFYAVSSLGFEIDKDTDGKLLFKGYVSDLPFSLNSQINQGIDQMMGNLRQQSLMIERPEITSQFWIASYAPTSTLDSMKAVIDIADVQIGKIGTTGGTNGGTSGCRATYALDNGSLRVPCVDVPGPFGGSITYLIEMKYQTSSSPMAFSLIAASPSTDTNLNDACRATYSMTDSALHIPCVDIPGPFGSTFTYAVYMSYLPFSNPMSFMLTGATVK